LGKEVPGTDLGQTQIELPYNYIRLKYISIIVNLLLNLVEVILSQPGLCARWRELTTRNHRYIRNLLNRYLEQESRSQRVLEIGCGVGFVSQMLPQHYYFGIDLSYHYLRYAKKHYAASYACMDAQNMGIKAGSQDWVLVFAFFHHLSDSGIQEFIKEIKRVLRGGGFLLWMDGLKVDDAGCLPQIVLKLDRGEHFRTPDQYRSLFTPHFRSVAEFWEDVWPWQFFGMLLENV